MPAPLRMLPILPALLLAGVLSACGTADVAGALTPVQGDVVVPPLAGTAEFLGYGGQGAPFHLAQAAVDGSGAFQLTLPVPAALPSGGNAFLLPLAPSAELLEYRSFTCPPAPAPSDAGGRVVLVKLGNYRVSGQLTGQLLPAVTSVSSSTSTNPTPASKVTSEMYAYADRNFTVQGTLNCTMTALDGAVQTVPVQVNYDLKRGWNRLTLQTVLSGADLSVNALSSTMLDGVHWRYLPVTP